MLQSTRSCRTLHALFACHNNGSSSLPLLFDCEYCALAARSPLAIIVKAPAGCSPPALSACHNSNGSAASRCSLIVNLVLSLHPTNCCNDIDGWSMFAPTDHLMLSPHPQAALRLRSPLAMIVMAPQLTTKGGTPTRVWGLGQLWYLAAHSELCGVLSRM